MICFTHKHLEDICCAQLFLLDNYSYSEWLILHDFCRWQFVWYNGIEIWFPINNSVTITYTNMTKKETVNEKDKVSVEKSHVNTLFVCLETNSSVPNLWFCLSGTIIMLPLVLITDSRLLYFYLFWPLLYRLSDTTEYQLLLSIIAEH